MKNKKDNYIVRGWIKKDIPEFFASFDSYEEARATAKKLAELYKGHRFYCHQENSHPLDMHYYMYDNYFKEAVEFCCND